MALDSTVGGANANSYVSLSEANTFFTNHYSAVKTSTWAALSDAQKEAVLKRATQVLDTLRVLDSEFAWGPALASPFRLVSDYDITIHRQMENQRLQFPRNIDLDANDAAYVPQDVKDAQCEQAIHLLTFDESALLTALSGVTEETLTAGPIRSRQVIGRTGTFLSPLALELMRPYCRPTNRVQRA